MIYITKEDFVEVKENTFSKAIKQVVEILKIKSKIQNFRFLAHKNYLVVVSAEFRMNFVFDKYEGEYYVKELS